MASLVELFAAAVAFVQSALDFQGLALPLHSGMEESDVATIAENLIAVLGESK